MADGIDISTSGNPWIITFHSGAGTALPATIIGAQNTGNQAYPFLPKRIVWQGSATTAAGDAVVLKDVPANGGTARVIANFRATGANFEPPQEWERHRSDAGFVGLQVTTMASGDLYIYF